MKILLITPPMTQINTPYPATGYLCSFLKSLGHTVIQKDLGLDLFLKVFSETGLTKARSEILKKNKISDQEANFIAQFDEYHSCINPIISFLQGKDPSMATRIARRMLVPEGARFDHINMHDEVLDVFGSMGTHDQAKFIASLYLDDISDIIKSSLDERFEFSRYGESLASSQSSFTPLYESLKSRTFVDDCLDECVEEYLKDFMPEVCGFTLPFPGNVYGALRAALKVREINPLITTITGGGFVNTELRELGDPRFFEFFDYITFDDGELPLKNLLAFLEGKKEKTHLVRTWYLENCKITKSLTTSSDVAFRELSGPSYDGLELSNYVSMLEMPNPMHRMWSDFRWNKMILAHGCYWKKCTFCDVSLDYIQRYEPARVDSLINSIQTIARETKNTGFHFVDEAAPPALVKSLSEALIENKMKISWWGNLRFDKSFEHLAEIMAQSGCIAVTGGLEVASPRILKLIDKGTSVEQVARVTKSFSNAGIYVHSYLMYGFPTQTIQETVDSLEVVRQLFLNDCIQSGYWHRFMCTAHSPVGKKPDSFGIKLIDIPTPSEGLFAKNTVEFIDSEQPDLDMLGDGLKRALYNYMYGLGLEEDVRMWFSQTVPKAKVSKNFIENAISDLII